MHGYRGKSHNPSISRFNTSYSEQYSVVGNSALTGDTGKKQGILALNIFATRSTIGTNTGSTEYIRYLHRFAGDVPPPQQHVER